MVQSSTLGIVFQYGNRGYQDVPNPRNNLQSMKIPLLIIPV